MQVNWKCQPIGPVMFVSCGPRAVALENLGPPLPRILFFFFYLVGGQKKNIFFLKKEKILNRDWQSQDSRLKQSLDVLTPNEAVQGGHIRWRKWEPESHTVPEVRNLPNCRPAGVAKTVAMIVFSFSAENVLRFRLIAQQTNQRLQRRCRSTRGWCYDDDETARIYSRFLVWD